MWCKRYRIERSKQNIYATGGEGKLFWLDNLFGFIDKFGGLWFFIGKFIKRSEIYGGIQGSKNLSGN
jgi:hypothetical protein